MTDDLRQLLSRASAELRAGRPACAAPLYRRALAQAPGHAEATHFLGLALLQAGEGDEGVAAMMRSIALDPAQPMYALNAALALAEAGRADEAERVLRDAIAGAPAAAPALPPLHNALGAVLQRRGAWHAAREALEQAARLAPGDDTAHNNLGYVLLECGDVDAAVRCLREARRLNPSNATACNNLGNALLAKGDADGAEAAYRDAVAAAPAFAGGHYNLGRLLLERGRTDEALRALATSVRLAPQQPGPWQAFADALSGVRFGAPDHGMAEMMTACLAREDVEPTNLALAALSLLRADPEFEALLDAPDPRWEDALRAARRPLLTLLLENVIVPDPGFERMVARLRRAALIRAAPGPAATAADAELACAIAQQCLLTEYAAGGTPEEVETLGRLGRTAGPAFARLARRQVAEPAEERRLRQTIVSLTAVGDDVSRAVQAQYEENPYPRWHRAPAFVGAYPLSRKLRTLFPSLPPQDLEVPDGMSVLVAGCGTGRHAAITARQYPGARILAVDLSAASLAFAMRRFAEIGIGNVRFARADLLELGALEERFELIECAGVLHHLEDPLAGLRVLAGLLRPRGFMNLALYSERGRAAVVAARRFIAARGFPATPEGMRAARAAIVALPEGAEERGVLDSADFYSMSGCRDLLFHVMEHRYTPEDIDALLRAADLELLGYETERTATFAPMYQFWARRR